MSFSYNGAPDSAQSAAEQHSLETLLRCYVREIATPAGLIVIKPLRFAELYGCQLAPRRPFLAEITLPLARATILAPLDRRSPVGIFEADRFWLQQGEQLVVLTWALFVPLLLRELEQRFGRKAPAELVEQLGCSVAVTAAILRSKPAVSLRLARPVQAYVDSEQALVYGHPYHPTPKARSGLSGAALQRFSPELRASFALHYFAVQRQFICQQSVLGESASDLVLAEGPSHLLPGPDWVLLPVHPWQATYLLGLAPVAAAVAAGKLRHLGAYGPLFAPTASIRTLFSPSSRFFYKTSLSFRITNCLRRNAVPEMAASLRISRLMRDLAGPLAAAYPGFRALEEHAYLSVTLPGLGAEDERLVSEGFGLMLRENLEAHRRPGEVCLLPAALFGNGEMGRSLLRQVLREAAKAYPEASPLAVSKMWFKAYLEALLEPLLYLYTQAGIMFEPHLQNVVMAFKDGMATGAYLRDFENARLVASQLSPALELTLTSSEKAELIYADAVAWKRFAYCLFTNHLTEAVRQLSFGQPELEPQLWDLVKTVCLGFVNRYHAHRCSELVALVSGEPLPAKTNLITRFTAGKDGAAGYVAIGSPWAEAAVAEADAAAGRSRGALPLRSVVRVADGPG